VRAWVAVALLAPAAFAVVSYLRLPDDEDVRRFAGTAPALSSFMRARLAEPGAPARLRREFVPLSRVSPLLQRAVVLGEDAAFWTHDGVDWTEMRRAAAQSWQRREPGRGASTITMQLARNLWLGEERSIVRKAKEIVLARRLEQVLSKRRILELYLSYAEWGEGVFGAEAAARAHFSKSAAALSAGEAAVLAAMLPAPRRWNPATPTPRFVQRCWRMADLLATDGRMSARAARAQVAAIVGPRPGRR